MSSSSDVIFWFLPWIPVILVWTGGAFLSLVTWRRHRGVSMMALLGCVVLIVSTLVGTTLEYWFVNHRAGLGWTRSQLGWALTAIGVIRMTCRTVGNILFFFAIFCWRQNPMGDPVNETLPGKSAQMNPHPPSEDFWNRPGY